MTIYAALILICVKGMALDACTPATASQVLEVADTLSLNSCIARATDYWSVNAIPYRVDAKHFARWTCELLTNG